jgi:hypothetical protein
MSAYSMIGHQMLNEIGGTIYKKVLDVLYHHTVDCSSENKKEAYMLTNNNKSAC